MGTIEKLVDLLETQEPECVVTVNTGYTYEDEEIALQDLMEDKMAWYDPLKDGYTIDIESY